MLKKRLIRFLVTAGLFAAVLICLSRQTSAERVTPIGFEQKGLLRVKVHLLSINPISKQPVVFLADPLKERALPICIGLFEANAIYSELQGIRHRRPLTHDLLKSIILKADEKIHRVIITHQKEGIYYATIVMNRRGSLVEIDARPSDSIVMALKFKAPIFVTKSLFRDLAIPLAKQREVDEQYGLTLQELTDTLAEYFSFGSTHGVLVSEVHKGSRAEKDGIKRGDIFVELAGKTVENVRSLKDALTKSSDVVQARIYRKARFLSITLHPK